VSAIVEKLLPRLILPIGLLVGSVALTWATGGSVSNLLGSSFSWARTSLTFQQSVALVAELPNVPEAQDSKGHHLDLGYHYTYDGGEWVARINDVEYYSLTPELQSKMLQLAHLDKLPLVPQTSRSNYLTKVNFAIAIVPLSLLLVLIAKILGFLPKPPDNDISSNSRNSSASEPKRNQTRQFGKRDE
jgi:hypothetical protein